MDTDKLVGPVAKREHYQLCFMYHYMYMDTERLKALVADGLSISEIVTRLNYSKSTIVKWIKRLDLKLANAPFTLKPANCVKCGITSKTQFYGHKKSLCKKHYNEYRNTLALGKRKIILDILGNKCASCGFNKYKSALAIHHLDPGMKDKNFATHRGWSIDRIKKEIKTCVLLCSNCHLAVHNNELTLGQ